jgi:hypothetical protein
MENFFSAIMYWVFGKRWILYSMRTGIKVAVFANELELKWAEQKHEDAIEARNGVEAELAYLQDIPLRDARAELGADADSQAVYELDKQIREERKRTVSDLQSHLSSLEKDVQMAEGERARVQQIVYSNRRKWDYVKKATVFSDYTDR